MKRLLFAVGVILMLGAMATSVFAAPPVAYTNFLANSNFALGFGSWTRFGNTVWDVVNGSLTLYSTASTSGIYQDTTYTSTTGDIFLVTLDMGNSSNALKQVRIRIYGLDNGLTPVQCNFNIAAFSPMQTYRYVGKSTGSFNTIRFQIDLNTHDSQPGLVVDNVNAQLWSASQETGTTCTSPASTATPTSTPTHTPTPTRTPDVAVVWPLPTTVNDLGTPQPAQYVRFTYQVSAGDVAVSTLLAALVLTILSVFTIWLLIGRQRRS